MSGKRRDALGAWNCVGSLCTAERGGIGNAAVNGACIHCDEVCRVQGTECFASEHAWGACVVETMMPCGIVSSQGR
jgi:hypothetical protein